MLNWLKRMFCSEQPTLSTPKPGEVFTFKDDSDCPFERPIFKVEVLEVREGWVRYKFLGSSMFQNEVMKLSSFRHCYK